MTEGLALLPDRFGQTVAEFAAAITPIRVRRWNSGTRRFFHRPRNGAHDPLTQFHVLIAILSLKPDTRFTARQLTEQLKRENDYFSWDSVTIGRIIMDIAESTALANGSSPIITRRSYLGNFYSVRGTAEDREVLARLADDLYDACEAVIQTEAVGERVSRLSSPLAQLPSLHKAALD